MRIIAYGYFRTLSALNQSAPPPEAAGRKPHGTEIKMRTEPVATEQGAVVEVPALSGNSHRGRARRIITDKMLEILQLEKRSLDPRVIDWLYSGGGLATDEKNTLTPDTDQELRVLFPQYALFGASTLGTIMEGETNFGTWYAATMASPPSVFGLKGTIFEELEERYRQQTLPHPKDILGQYHFTKLAQLSKVFGDEFISQYEKEHEIKLREALPVTVQYVVPNTFFTGWVALQETATAVEQAALRLALEAIFAEEKNGEDVQGGAVTRGVGYLGAQGARGFGRVESCIVGLTELPKPEVFLKHVEENADALKAYLTSGKLVPSKKTN